MEEIGPGYRFDVSCQGSVPESIIAFLDAHDYESIRNGLSLGGDADTIACIAGGIRPGFFRKIPAEIVADVKQKLTLDLLAVVDSFNQKYKCDY